MALDLFRCPFLSRCIRIGIEFVLHLDCIRHLYNVTPSSSQGICCIALKGYEQHTWLTASIIIIFLSIVFEAFDLVILLLVSGTERWRGEKMKRPWFTIFTGNPDNKLSTLNYTFQALWLRCSYGTFCSVVILSWLFWLSLESLHVSTCRRRSTKA